jgi:hypothetical protein
VSDPPGWGENMASTNNSLAQTNKSRNVVRATKQRPCEIMLNMAYDDEYRIVINEAQRRLIMRALTNTLAHDRLLTEGGSLSRSTPDEWVQLIRLFSTIKPLARKA